MRPSVTTRWIRAARHGLAAVVVGLPVAAHAGTCTVSVADDTIKVTTEPGSSAEKTGTFGRWPGRVVVLQSKVDGKYWSWDIKVERKKDDVWETLAHPRLQTGPDMDGIAETSSRLGPVTVTCHD
ncbi:MAG: hypothetical protein H6733_14075 [Alphaproteobacteria bacterium]|nr:hypothetical protein [Alphaproteobacteria bacterium]